MKNNKGITLIALIITIVVLLILAMVAISAVSDNGIIAKAQKAKDSYGDAADKENQTIGGYASELEKYGADGGEIKVDFETILQDLKSDPSKYLDQAQALGQPVDMQDIGIGTDGKVVNLNLWIYQRIRNNEIQLCEGSGDGSGYKGSIIGGKIQGTIPQYIYSEGKIYTVTSLWYAFMCINDLVIAPAIPSSVTNVNNTFVSCTNLKKAPTIPSSVTNAASMFSGCTSLTQAPEIPSSVTNAGYMFQNCTSLEVAPTIPSSVTDAYSMFRGCTNLSGRINILSNNYNSYYDFLYGVGSAERPITLIGNGTNGNLLKELKATGNSDYITIEE